MVLILGYVDPDDQMVLRSPDLFPELTEVLEPGILYYFFFWRRLGSLYQILGIYNVGAESSEMITMKPRAFCTMSIRRGIER